MSSEAAVEAAVGEVAHQGQVVLEYVSIRQAGDDEFPVRLQQHGESLVVTAGKIGRHASISPERCIQSAVRLVARQGDVRGEPSEIHASGRDELAVRLDYQGQDTTI